MDWRTARWSAVFVLLVFAALGQGMAATCSSSSGCTDCKDNGLGFKCVFVTTDASCRCDLFIFGGRAACGVDGDCTYTPVGGGNGGGTGGGGGTTCTRLAGQWCPSECSSCETVFWY